MESYRLKLSGFIVTLLINTELTRALGTRCVCTQACMHMSGCFPIKLYFWSQGSGPNLVCGLFASFRCTEFWGTTACFSVLWKHSAPFTKWLHLTGSWDGGAHTQEFTGSREKAEARSQSLATSRLQILQVFWRCHRWVSLLSLFSHPEGGTVPQFGNANEPHLIYYCSIKYLMCLLCLCRRLGILYV